MVEETKVLSTIQPSDMAMGVFSSASMYGEYHKIAANLAGSTLIPKEFQGNASNVMIALNLSSRMGADPLAIMQSMYIVHGKPSFSASFIGGILEESGKFGFLDYQYQNEPAPGEQPAADYGCRIVTTVKATGQEIQGPLITVAMAKAEGWWNKSGSKWPALTETMLGNRAITFFARRYAGSILLGMNSTDELEDMKEINPVPGQEKMSKDDMTDALVGEVETVVPHETTDKKPEEKPVTAKKTDPKKSAADKKAESEKKTESEDTGQESSGATEKSDSTGKQDSSSSGNPWTADDLVKNIEQATEISMVNDALSSTTGFSKADQNRVLKAAGIKNKELAAANKDK